MGDAETGPLQRLRAEMARAPFHAFLNPEATAVDAGTGTVTILLPFRAEFRRAYDVDDYHGGILAALIDLTAHAAVAVQSGAMAPTIDLRVDFLARVPLDQQVRAGGDSGDPIVFAQPQSPTAIALRHFARVVAAKISVLNVRQEPQLKII